MAEYTPNKLYLNSNNSDNGIFSETYIIQLLNHRSKFIPFFQAVKYNGLISTPPWKSNHIPSKVWDGLTYPFPNFNTPEVCLRMNN